MKIEAVETHLADRWVFVRVRTDAGIDGIGEATYFGWPDAVARIVESFGERLRGADPLRVEHHWLDLYRNRSMRGTAVGAALSALDQALWDIRGKRFDAPVWQLLGGEVRPSVRAMLVLPHGGVEELATAAAGAVRQGFDAVKVMLFQPEHHRLTHARRIGDLVRRAEAVREVVGWDVDIAIELHRNMGPGDSVVLCQELEQLRPLFVEDPIPPESVMALADVSRKVRVPLAAGERNSNLWEFGEYAFHAGVSYLRPDVGIAGGITHLRKICAVAEARHQRIAPHAVPSGPVATAAHVQLGVATPNWDVQEHRDQSKGPWASVVDQVVPLAGGHLRPADCPGLGIELDDAGLENTPPFIVTAETPVRADGSIAFS